MGDRAGVRMILAGSIPSAAAIEALKNAVVSENAKPDWNQGIFEDGDFLCLLQDSLEQGERISFCAEDKLGASMDDVETVCREHGIAYETHGDRGAEWDSFVRRWQPGMAKPSTASGDRDPVVSARKVQELLAKGPEGVQQLSAMVERKLGLDFPKKIDASPEVRDELEALIKAEYGEDAEPASAPAP